MSSIILERLQQAQKLPLGHIERKKAQEAVEEVYGPCQKIESKWAKRLSRKHILFFVDPRNALSICLQLCEMTGTKPLKKIIFNSQDVSSCAGAHYDFLEKEIHLKWNFCSLTTLIHELTHHIERRDVHGELFQWTENYLFSLLYTMLTGKEPNNDW
jgi:hypothetical protein